MIRWPPACRKASHKGNEEIGCKELLWKEHEQRIRSKTHTTSAMHGDTCLQSQHSGGKDTGMELPWSA
jgi:hypothetical protein